MPVQSTRAGVASTAVLIAFCLTLAGGCSPAGRHAALTTIFDGVPAHLPEDQLCRNYVEALEAKRSESQEQQLAKVETSANQSRHEPYTEKRCSDCHDKEKQDGLVKPKLQLCFECHPDIVSGTYQHGPAAVGDCLSCHMPHTANFAPLLKLDRSGICSSCHQEKRLAVVLHDSAAKKGLACPDCHDPHGGNALFFIK